jgi:hypothetical protein
MSQSNSENIYCQVLKKCFLRLLMRDHAVAFFEVITEASGNLYRIAEGKIPGA